MGRSLVSELEFPNIVNYYNDNGRKATYAMIQATYGIKQPRHLILRIRNTGIFPFDEERDRFEITDNKTAEDALFLNLDTLCSSQSSDTSKEHTSEPNNITMENLIHELISDRLLMLSRYITMDIASRTIRIDRTSLTDDGYQVLVY